MDGKQWSLFTESKPSGCLGVIFSATAALATGYKWAVSSFLFFPFCFNLVNICLYVLVSKWVAEVYFLVWCGFGTLGWGLWLFPNMPHTKNEKMPSGKLSVNNINGFIFKKLANIFWIIGSIDYSLYDFFSCFPHSAGSVFSAWGDFAKVSKVSVLSVMQNTKLLHRLQVNEGDFGRGVFWWRLHAYSFNEADAAGALNVFGGLGLVQAWPQVAV